MGFWEAIWYLFVAMATSVAGYFIQRSQQKKPERPTAGVFTYPTTEEGIARLVIFGKPPRMMGPALLWYGTILLTEHTQDDVHVAWSYNATVHLGWCLDADGFKQLWYGDDCFWPNLKDETVEAADGQTQAVIYQPEALGGWQGEGGWMGVMYLEYGGPAQTTNGLLAMGAAGVWGVITSITGDSYVENVTITAAVFGDYAAGYFDGGTLNCAGVSVPIETHTGSTVTLPLDTGFGHLSVGMGFTATPPSGSWPVSPANRGFVGSVGWMYWGTNPYVRKVSAVLKRTDILTGGGTQWYLAKAKIGTDNLNPAHIIREAYTDGLWGKRIATARLGTSFTTAADTFYAEGLGLSGVYAPRPGGLKELLKVIEEHADCFVYHDPATDKYELALARGDYDIDELEAFDQDDFEIIEHDRPTPYQVPGRVVMKWSNRYWPENVQSLPYDDLAIQLRQGRVNEIEVERLWACDAAVAGLLLTRVGRQFCTPLSRMVLKTKRTMSHLHRGSVIKISYDRSGLEITQMAVRVLSINYGSLLNETVTLRVVEDVYASHETIYTAEPGGWTAPVAPYPGLEGTSANETAVGAGVADTGEEILGDVLAAAVGAGVANSVNETLP